jgi:hypothetical protein
MDKQYCGYELLKGESGNKIELQYYILKQSQLYLEICEVKIAYGIEIVKNEFLENKDVLTEENSIEDITTNMYKIKDIIKTLKDNQVMPIHLKDVIENII